MAVYCASLPPTPSSGPWKSWVLGVLVMVILPFCKQKWGSLLPILKREVDTVVEETETVADVVEKVAVEVEKVADEVADELPKGGKVTDAVRHVEDIAKEIAKDAEVVEEINRKVEEVKKCIESAIAPSMDKENVVPKENTDKRSKL